MLMFGVSAAMVFAVISGWPRSGLRISGIKAVFNSIAVTRPSPELIHLHRPKREPIELLAVEAAAQAR